MSNTAQEKKSPLREIIQPFIDLIHAPRALWGINLAYVIEGMVYFGMLLYLAIYFSDFIFRGVENADDYSHKMVGVLTAGITLAMVFLGFVADKWGVRIALISAFVLMLFGRALIAGAPNVLGLQPAGLWSPLHLVTMLGILFVVVGYGMYQPAAYAGVRQFTTPRTAGMGFAMLYALMNLGAWLPTFAFLLRDEDYLGLGIPGTYWVYTGFTAVALLVTVLILSRKTVAKAIATAKAETARIREAEAQKHGEKSEEARTRETVSVEPVAPEKRGAPLHLWGLVIVLAIAFYFTLSAPWWYVLGGALVLAGLVITVLPTGRRWIAAHPLADAKFFFFIFALIPVQTLFTYNWFVLPQYISRAYEGWIGNYYEVFSSLNALLIFIIAPIIAAITQRRKVYNMMIVGTFIMGAPAFFLVIGPSFWTLAGYIVFMTIGEAMWQPRFLQYAAEIAPEGRTGVYMGVAQLPWFLTKVLVPLLYSGKVMARYCPAEGPKDTQTMWLIFGCIAITSTILLLLAKGWIGKDFKTKHEE
jgi:POT family proton-dependent oligopeptide transporter